ncbi:MAG TPA: DUF2637 domain-containing protein [Streptosporangiaceae bacterium]|nr:DUF2637 domain-containing protein [Streptosporangiaceae bacterium]
MSDADRAIRVSAAVAVFAVAGIAAYVSYWQAYEVVRAHGENGVTARLEPVTIDGLVNCPSMVVLYAAWHQLPVTHDRRVARSTLVSASVDGMSAGKQPAMPMPEREPAALRAAVARLDPAALPKFEADWTTAIARTRDEYSLLPGISSSTGSAGLPWNAGSGVL